jgi:ATPase subunit of ABC transporter with duplicated ATPase domains
MSTNWGESIVSFDEVSYSHVKNKPILLETSFNIRKNAKITLMGQNGAGKSTIFKLIKGEYEVDEGDIHIKKDLTIAVSRQVIPRPELELTVREFFQSMFKEKIYDIDPRIDEVLSIVNLKADKDKQIKEFSGGQQARLLLAQALIQKSDLILLDEPTNNLDKAGIDHLKKFLKEYTKTVIVISHDAEFLNSFTEGVIYLDIHTQKVEQYVGTYNTVVAEIAARVEKERRANAQAEKKIQENKDKANFFANKGGGMRLVAKRMREDAEEAEENMVDVRREDKTIKPFTIEAQEDLSGILIALSSVTVMDIHKDDGSLKTKKVHVELRKGDHLLLKGPNGIGKTTLLENLAGGHAKGEEIKEGVKIGYYRQDFSNLDFDKTPYQIFEECAAKDDSEHFIRKTLAQFLITGDIAYTQIGKLSEGQKGLVAFARLVAMRPGLLILDEPTNHINFRHLPVIAESLKKFQGAMIVVSHMQEFVENIGIDNTLDLGR